AAAMEANVAVDSIADVLEQFQAQFFWYRILAVQVTDCSSKRNDACCFHKCLGILMRAECLFDLVVIKCMLMHVGAGAKVMRFAFNQRACQLGVVNHFARGRNDLFVSSIMVGLTDIDMDELESGFYAGLGRFHAGTMVQINKDLYAELLPVVIYHITH